LKTLKSYCHVGQEIIRGRLQAITVSLHEATWCAITVAKGLNDFGRYFAFSSCLSHVAKTLQLIFSAL
jgi:hypothetical protein